MLARRGRFAKDGKKRSLGQVVVEMLLILPVFFAIIFTIMELGHLAFWVIVLNHATYEVARLGSLRAGPDPSASMTGIKDVNGFMNDKMRQVIPSARVTSFRQNTLRDRQAAQDNYDLVVTGQMEMRLVFPISSIALSNPRGSGRRLIAATIRMPIEQPLHR